MPWVVIDTIIMSSIIIAFLLLFLLGNRQQDINHIQLRRMWPDSKRYMIKEEMRNNWKYRWGFRLALFSAPLIVMASYIKFCVLDGPDLPIFIGAGVMAISGLALRMWGSFEMFASFGKTGRSE